MATKHVLEHTIDPSGYQYSVNRKTFEITVLSREDLLQIICEQMDVMENIDSIAQNLSNTVKKWRDC